MKVYWIFYVDLRQLKSETPPTQNNYVKDGYTKYSTLCNITLQ